jgi:hypothetical protein
LQDSTSQPATKRSTALGEAERRHSVGRAF